MPVEIKHKITGEVIRTVNADNLRLADLYQADLRYADLRQADLYQADLLYADLRQADLYQADLRYADLRQADLRYADLRQARGIVQIQGCIPYEINITQKYIGVGCQWHTAEEWLAMTLGSLKGMDNKAEQSWLDSLHTLIKTLMPFVEES